MQSRSGKSPGYCYLIRRRPGSCLLGHVTWLLFCLYVKLFLPSYFNSVDVWSSMSCILLGFELADISVIKELGVSNIEKLQEVSFRPPKKNQPTKQAFWCTRKMQGIVWNSECLDYSKRPNILSIDQKSENYAKRREWCKMFGKLLDRKVENMDDHGSPKIQDPFVEEMWTCSSYQFRHKTTWYCAEREIKLLDNCTMQQLNLKIFRFVKCFVSIYVNKSFI